MHAIVPYFFLFEKTMSSFFFFFEPSLCRRTYEVNIREMPLKVGIMDSVIINHFQIVCCTYCLDYISLLTRTRRLLGCRKDPWFHCLLGGGPAFIYLYLPRSADTELPQRCQIMSLLILFSLHLMQTQLQVT